MTVLQRLDVRAALSTSNAQASEHEVLLYFHQIVDTIMVSTLASNFGSHDLVNPLQTLSIYLCSFKHTDKSITSCKRQGQTSRRGSILHSLSCQAIESARVRPHFHQLGAYVDDAVGRQGILTIVVLMHLSTEDRVRTLGQRAQRRRPVGTNK